MTVHQSSTPSVEDEIRAVRQWEAAAPRRLALLPIVVLIVASAAFSIVGAFLDLKTLMPAISILLAVLAAVLSVVQSVDWMADNAVKRAYTEWAQRLGARLAARVRRRRLNRILSVHGRAELARQHLPPEEAEVFAVVRHRRRRGRVGAAVAAAAVAPLAVAAGLVVYEFTADESYSRGTAFTLNDTFEMTVVGGPRCHTPEGSDRVCTVDLAVVNVSRDPAYLVAFGDITSKGAYFRGERESVLRYATAAARGSRHYEFRVVEPAIELDPDGRVRAAFTYWVKGDAIIDELRFAVLDRPNVIVHAELGAPPV